MMDDHAPRRLRRSHDRKIAGVCGGIGEYLAIDPTLVRIGFAALFFLTAGIGALVGYAVLWAVIPGPGGDALTAGTGGVAADAGLTVGLVLLVFGLVLLLQRMPAVWAFGMGLLRFSIPLALIAIGVLLLASRGRR